MICSRSFEDKNRGFSICELKKLIVANGLEEASQWKSFISYLEWILDLRKELEIPHKLSDVIDINKLDIDELSEMALNDPSTASNPKTLTISDMKIIYKNSISGELFK